MSYDNASASHSPHPKTTEDHLPASPKEEEDAEPHSPPLCAGCSLRITDSEYLRAGPTPQDSIGRGDWCFHPSCLRCAECKADLTRERAFLAGSEANGGLRCSRHSGAE